MNKPTLSLTQDEYQGIIECITKKFSFDQMILQQTPIEYKAKFEAKLFEANSLFQRLEKHPKYITEDMAKWIVASLMEVQHTYTYSIRLLKQLGFKNTLELESDLRKAEAIHEKLNEFLIDCLED